MSCCFSSPTDGLLNSSGTLSDFVTVYKCCVDMLDYTSLKWRPENPSKAHKRRKRRSLRGSLCRITMTPQCCLQLCPNQSHFFIQLIQSICLDSVLIMYYMSTSKTKVRPALKCNKLQFLLWPLQPESISESSHVEMFNELHQRNKDFLWFSEKCEFCYCCDWLY